MELDKLVVIDNDYRNFPLGITKIEGGIHISAAASGEACSLVLYDKSGRQGSRKIPFPEKMRIGDVWSLDLLGEDLDGLEYCLEIDGREVPDRYGRAFTGREKWGDATSAHLPMRSLFAVEPFDWEDDHALKIPYEDSVIYRLHVRGFTKHVSSRVRDKGTFKGILEKIPYMKDLGVTAIEILPPYEFNEIMMTDGADGSPHRSEEPTGKINYWGYGPGYYFAPKASYASGREKHPVTEFKTMVRELHKAGLEIIVELYFSAKEDASMVQEAARCWVREFHVDGIHLVGDADAGALAGDPYLASTKLFAVSWNGGERPGMRHLAEYNDGFQMDMRRLLKGDEDQMNGLIFRSKRNPKEYGVINYMAHTNGLTMMDMVSFEQKHNEANGEENRDGSNYNYSWNCGLEGPTKKKKIVEMRRKQLRNAFLILLLSQGTPMILAGDEFGRTQGGNNNAYCQDNETSWLNWNLLHSNRDIYEFVKYVIEFRKKHPVFHMEHEPRVMDYLVCGHPDVSYHGVKAWCPEFENFRRQLGIMYCGEYGNKTDGTPDDYFFVAYNMHWEPHEFALPKLPKGMMWHVAFNTDEKDRNGIYEAGEEPVLEVQKQFMVSSRSIVVFIGKKEKIRSKDEKNMA